MLIKKLSWGGDSTEVDCMPSKHRVLGSIPSISFENKQVNKT